MPFTSEIDWKGTSFGWTGGKDKVEEALGTLAARVLQAAVLSGVVERLVPGIVREAEAEWRKKPGHGIEMERISHLHSEDEDRAMTERGYSFPPPEVFLPAPPTPAQVRAFYRATYMPSRVHVHVVGPVSLAAVEAAIKTHFGPAAVPLPAGAPILPALPHPIGPLVPMKRPIRVRYREPEYAAGESVVTIVERRGLSVMKTRADVPRFLEDTILDMAINEMCSKLQGVRATWSLRNTVRERAFVSYLRIHVPKGGWPAQLRASLRTLLSFGNLGITDADLARLKGVVLDSLESAALNPGEMPLGGRISQLHYRSELGEAVVEDACLLRLAKEAAPHVSTQKVNAAIKRAVHGVLVSWATTSCTAVFVVAPHGSGDEINEATTEALLRELQPSPPPPTPAAIVTSSMSSLTTSESSLPSPARGPLSVSTDFSANTNHTASAATITPKPPAPDAPSPSSSAQEPLEDFLARIKSKMSSVSDPLPLAASPPHQQMPAAIKPSPERAPAVSQQLSPSTSATPSAQTINNNNNIIINNNNTSTTTAKTTTAYAVPHPAAGPLPVAGRLSVSGAPPAGLTVSELPHFRPHGAAASPSGELTPLGLLQAKLERSPPQWLLMPSMGLTRALAVSDPSRIFDARTGLELRTLSNGVRLNAKRTADEPGRVVVAVVARGGRALAPFPGAVDVGVLTMFGSGAGRYTSETLQAYCVQHCLDVTVETEADCITLRAAFQQTGETGWGSPLFRALDLIHTFLSEPRFERAKLEAAGRTYATLPEDRLRAAMRALRRLLYDPPCPYFDPPRPEKAAAAAGQYTAITRAVVSQLCDPANLEVSVAGDFDPTELSEAALIYLGTLSSIPVGGGVGGGGAGVVAGPAGALTAADLAADKGLWRTPFAECSGQVEMAPTGGPAAAAAAYLSGAAAPLVLVGLRTANALGSQKLVRPRDWPPLPGASTPSSGNLLHPLFALAAAQVLGDLVAARVNEGLAARGADPVACRAAVAWTMPFHIEAGHVAISVTNANPDVAHAEVLSVLEALRSQGPRAGEAVAATVRTAQRVREQQQASAATFWAENLRGLQTCPDRTGPQSFIDLPTLISTLTTADLHTAALNMMGSSVTHKVVAF